MGVGFEPASSLEGNMPKRKPNDGRYHELKIESVHVPRPYTKKDLAKDIFFVCVLVAGVVGWGFMTHKDFIELQGRFPEISTLEAVLMAIAETVVLPAFICFWFLAIGYAFESARG